MSEHFKVLTGTKVQVYRGIAKQTSGGLTKKDIVAVKDSRGVTHYKSKKQQQMGKKQGNTSRSKWTESYLKALSDLTDRDSYYKDNILMFNPKKTYDSKFTVQQITKGNKLYNLTKKYYESHK